MIPPEGGVAEMKSLRSWTYLIGASITVFLFAAVGTAASTAFDSTTVALRPTVDATLAVKKQRVVINQLESIGRGTFTLQPIDSGPIVSDKGVFTWTHKPAISGTRDGQSFRRYDSVVTFAGKNGDLVVREIVTLVLAAPGMEAGTGTWKVLRGTEAYASVKGGGRLGAIVGARRPDPWRYEGFMTGP